MMSDRNGRRLIAAWLVTCQLMLSLWGPSPVFAQSGDVTPPDIEFQPLGEGRRGDTQVFSATVRDDSGVASVVLRYRFRAEQSYILLPMEQLAGTDIYTASIDGADTDVAVIQYYIDARDEIGNRSIEGFAFDPLERSLFEPDAPIAESAPADAAVAGLGLGLSTRQKIIYGALGVVLVGVLASVAGGGSDSGGSRPLGDDTDVPVTIVVDPLP